MRVMEKIQASRREIIEHQMTQQRAPSGAARRMKRERLAKVGRWLARSHQPEYRPWSRL